MPALSVIMLSPIVAYRDALVTRTMLAKRPSTLDGKVVGLVPNWRPSAVQILEALGKLLGERFHLKEVIMEPRMLQVPITDGKLIDNMNQKFDEIARRVDVVITASGD